MSVVTIIVDMSVVTIIVDMSVVTIIVDMSVVTIDDTVVDPRPRSYAAS